MAQTLEHTIKLTDFQAAEVDNGLDIDAADNGSDWGYLIRSKGSHRLGIVDTGRAVYRLTSARDILRDNAADSMATPGERLTYANRARSMQALLDKVIAACGGPEAVPAEYRRWL
jgi:hypothetical protein